MRRHESMVLTLSVGITLVWHGVSVAEVDTAWVRRYNGPGNGSDRAQAVRIDATGNVYVTGVSAGIGSNDFATVKYDALGNQLWERRYNGPGNSSDSPIAMAIDRQGSVYITGLSYDVGTSLDYATLKYDVMGELRWERRYNGPAGGDDWPMALCVDDDGGVYVTGWSEGGATGRDFATLKYDSVGTLLWARRYDGPIHEADAANAIALDSAGNVLVVGAIAVDSADDGEVMVYLTDFASLKYGPDGSLLWSRQYDGPSHWIDRAVAVQVDSCGGILVAGNSYGALRDSGDWALLKYDLEGQFLWSARYDGPSQLYSGANAIAVGPGGSVYAIGGRISVGPTGRDFATRKFTANGSFLWEKSYTGPGNRYDDLVGICVDGVGSAYVTGRITGDNLRYDWATLMYDANGGVAWQESYNGPADGDDEPAALALGTNGTLVVSGYGIGTMTDRDFTTIKYLPCLCPCHGDPQCDGIRSNTQDVVATINVAFRGEAATQGQACPQQDSDVNCSGSTDVLDVVGVVSVAFRGGDPAMDFCRPCGQ